MQAELMYPHIANTDSKASINATWLRSLNNRNYHFTEWQDEKTFRAVIGPKGERAIINGDIMPALAGLSVHPLAASIAHFRRTGIGCGSSLRTYILRQQICLPILAAASVS